MFNDINDYELFNANKEIKELKAKIKILEIDANSFKNLQEKLAEANARIVEFERIKEGHLEILARKDRLLSEYYEENKKLRARVVKLTINSTISSR
jgi:hypothetical protein